MSATIIGNRKHEELLIKVNELYGRGHWECKYRTMSRIHGIHVESVAKLREIWYHLNLINRIEPDVSQTVKYGIKYKAIPRFYIQAMYIQYGKHWDQKKVVDIFQRGMRQAIYRLNLIFSKQRCQNKQIFAKLRIKTIWAILQCRDMKFNTQLAHDIQVSSIVLSELVLMFFQNRHCGRAAQYEMFIKYISKKLIIRVLEHLKYLEVLTKISDKIYCDDELLIGKSIYHEKTIEDNKNSEIYQQIYRWIDIISKQEDNFKIVQKPFSVQEINQGELNDKEMQQLGFILNNGLQFKCLNTINESDLIKQLDDKLQI